MALELTYSRDNIVRTVAIGFTLGALVLSVGGFVIMFGLALLDNGPFTLSDASARLLLAPIVLLGAGIIIGWVVRLGLGLVAWWQYRRSEAAVKIEDVMTGKPRG